ncbi:MAG: DUF6259 domain-containing protein [Victivallaceae bacterium]|nr:DUF6259 domain-containing protein [Victivallaceae bacterium]
MHTIFSGLAHLKLSAAGVIEECCFDRITPLRKNAGWIFRLGLLDSQGEWKLVESGEFTKIEPEGEAFRFSRHPELGPLEVVISIRGGGDGLFRFRPRVSGSAAGLKLVWIDFPPVTVPGDWRIFWPHNEGVEVRRPELHQVYGIPGWPNASCFGYYPGACQMQFMAAYNSGGNGIYFAAHDCSASPKSLDFYPQPDGSTRLSIQCFCGTEDEEYHPDFDCVLASLNGGWIGAAECYRAWMERTLHLPKLDPDHDDSPLADSPVTVIYPVKGEGLDVGPMKPNEYFPYRNALLVVRRWAKAFESRIIALLMHWEGTAPWAPPYVWPPYGGEALLTEFRDRLHREGHLLGVYCSGTAWTQQSCIETYSREQECTEAELEQHMIRGPKGELDAAICCGPDLQRLGYDMCLTEEWSRRIVKEEIRKLAAAGIDYAQFFDQNRGGSSHNCYAAHHRHPPVPGLWMTEAMRSLLAECRNTIREIGSTMFLGAEGAAAEPYIASLPFNDLRFNWECVSGVPVPAYAFVYHEYINNFQGNQCGLDWQLDFINSPDNLRWRTAYSFCAGDLLSIVLGRNGALHWGWNIPWDETVPEAEQQNAATLIFNLNAMRKRYPEFLRYGRMLRPGFKVSSPQMAMPFKSDTIEVDIVLSSFWRSRDEREVLILANSSTLPQPVSCCDGKSMCELVVPALSATVVPVSKGFLAFPQFTNKSKLTYPEKKSILSVQ